MRLSRARQIAGLERDLRLRRGDPNRLLQKIEETREAAAAEDLAEMEILERWARQRARPARQPTPVLLAMGMDEYLSGGEIVDEVSHSRRVR